MSKELGKFASTGNKFDPAKALVDKKLGNTGGAFSKDIGEMAAPAAGPRTMPTADDEAIRAARRRRAAEMQSRGGRASTVLSGTEDRLGG